MFNFFKKKEDLQNHIVVNDDAIVAIADGQLIDVTTVPDPVFAEKMMGDSIAFTYEGDKVVLCSPANGELSVLFPTGHAFGITTKHGVNTVEANGDGFTVLSKKQGDNVKAGDPIVEVDLKKLRAKYNMSTMLVVTNANTQTIEFIAPTSVKLGQSIIK